MDIKSALIAVADMSLFAKEEIEHELNDLKNRLEVVNDYLKENCEVPKLGISQNQMYEFSKAVAYLKKVKENINKYGIKKDSRLPESLFAAMSDLDSSKLERLAIDLEEGIRVSHEVVSMDDEREGLRYSLLEEKRGLNEQIKICEKALEVLSRLSLPL